MQHHLHRKKSIHSAKFFATLWTGSSPRYIHHHADPSISLASLLLCTSIFLGATSFVLSIIVTLLLLDDQQRIKTLLIMCAVNLILSFTIAVYIDTHESSLFLFLWIFLCLTITKKSFTVKDSSSSYSRNTNCCELIGNLVAHLKSASYVCEGWWHQAPCSFDHPCLHPAGYSGYILDISFSSFKG